VTYGTGELGRGAGRISRRTAAWFAWSVWALTVVFSAVSPLMPIEQNPASFLAFVGVMTIAYSTVGAIIISRRPKNPIGWIVSAFGFLIAWGQFSGLYAFHALVARPGLLPGGEAAAWFAAWLAGPAWGLFPYLLLLFPNGTPLSRRWRPLLWVNGILIAVSVLVGALYSGPIGFGAVRNPIGIEAAEDVLTFVGDLGFYLYTALLLLSVVSVYLRFRHAGGTERQQIKWLAYAAALLGCLALVDTIVELLFGWFAVWFDLLIVGALLCLPVSIGVAVLRYRLYDIDRLINRTLVYGLLTATLALLYFGSVTATQTLLRTLTDQQELPQLVVVASTLVIAALFTPLRRRIQGFIDKRFYRSKYDARKTLEAFSAKLRDETDLEVLNDDLVGVVRETMQPAHVSLWLRPDTALEDRQIT
jgi:hypothetical protein